MSTGTHRRRSAVKALLGGALAFAGVSHLTFARDELQAQARAEVPFDPDTTVVAAIWSTRR